MDDDAFRSPKNIMFIWRWNFSTRDKKSEHKNYLQIIRMFPDPFYSVSFLNMRHFKTSYQSTRKMLEIVSNTKLVFEVTFTPSSVVNQIIHVHKYRSTCLVVTIKPFTERNFRSMKKILHNRVPAYSIRPSADPLPITSENLFKVLYKQRSLTSLSNTNYLILVKYCNTPDWRKILESTTKFTIVSMQYPSIIYSYKSSRFDYYPLCQYGVLSRPRIEKEYTQQH